MKLVSWNIDRLEELVELWNKELGSEFPMRKELFEQNSFMDENIMLDASRIAVDEQNHVIGFLVAKRYQEELEAGMKKDIGWIQVLVVDKRFRKQGIGSSLLEHAEKTFKEQSIHTILLGRDPWHYFPGIPEPYEEAAGWFEKRGYDRLGSDYDLACSYHSETEINFPKFKGVEFSILDRKDKELFLSFLNRCFPGRWEYEALHYFEKGGTGREFVVLKKENDIIGFCRINDSKSPYIAQNVNWAPLFKEEAGGIGPLGIDAKERKNGYGLAVVQAGIAHLRKRNVNTIVIDWTGLVEFYGKLGYDVWKTYHSYRKTI